MTDMALFFSLLTRTFSLIDGLRPRFHLYAPPGPFTYEYQLYDLVKGADGIVFVADSQAVRCGDNVESLTDLEHQLAGHGRELRKIPLVIQYNKRDLPQTLPVTELDALLPGYECPRFEAVAVVGSGVFETLRTITQAVVAPLQGVDSTGSGQ
jgi:signal recognition particle receptor subunit beta